MSFQNFKSDSYCVGGRHRSCTKDIFGDITSKDSNVLIVNFSICNRKKRSLFAIIQNKLKDLENSLRM